MVGSAFTLLLSFCVMVVGASLGRRAMGLLALGVGLDPIECIAFSFALGMGLIGLGVYALGLAGLLRQAWIIVFVILAGLVSAPGVVALRQDFVRAGTDLRSDWKAARVGLLLVLGLVAMIFLLSLLLALAPPWGYDGLMYHLQAPRLFLQAGRILPLPQIVQANGPLLIQMLYGIGLALGTDTFSQVLHVVFAWVLLFALLGAGRRLLGPPGGWISAGILLGIPIFPLWGTLAYVDMAQAVYEFLAVWAVLRWRDDQRRPWLVLSALMAGLALGTKLMALFMLPAVCLWLVMLARKRGWRHAIGLGTAYGLMACLVAAPWYLFNLVSLGDPFFPFLRGGYEWPAARVSLHLEYLRSFGTGRSLLDFILLPWNLYFRHEAYAALMASIEYPSFLFPLALLLPFVSLSPGARPLAGLAVLRLAAWYLGSQQTRFLLPLYPVGCLMVAAVMLGVESRLHLRLAFPRWTGAITAGLVVTTLVYLSISTFEARPYAVLLGRESKENYLLRKVYDYRALSFIRSQLPREARVLQLWDGQGYYCDDRCIPDAGQVQAVYLHQLGPTVEAMEAQLHSRGITHVLVDLEGLNFLLGHDPKGTHAAAARFYLREFLPQCGKQIYEDPLVHIYRLTCSSQASAGFLNSPPFLGAPSR